MHMPSQGGRRGVGGDRHCEMRPQQTVVSNTQRLHAGAFRNAGGTKITHITIILHHSQDLIIQKSAKPESDRSSKTNLS